MDFAHHYPDEPNEKPKNRATRRKTKKKPITPIQELKSFVTSNAGD